ncbi:MAG: crossover junction endodeoxyribonuclease RuvC [Acidobacteria bacterium]|nr:crossover junction endodeoxyribonuclease RuvC [Acidobacteriota bacterium]
MRVLGVDCGSERTGYGVIDSDGRVHRILAAGTIRTSARDPFPARLAKIAGGLREVMSGHGPSEAAVEAVFHAVNAQSALKLAHVRGAVLLVLAEAGLSCAEYSALEVKQSVTGFGRADKEQVQFMMRSMFGSAAPVNQADACDALAVAVCHAVRSTFTRRMGAAS